jgi:hypothetical protein
MNAQFRSAFCWVQKIIVSTASCHSKAKVLGTLLSKSQLSQTTVTSLFHPLFSEMASNTQPEHHLGLSLTLEDGADGFAIGEYVLVRIPEPIQVLVDGCYMSLNLSQFQFKFPLKLLCEINRSKRRSLSDDPL